MKKNLLVGLVVLFAPVLVYLRLWSGFFQQDEWYGFAWYVLHKDLGLLDSISFFFAPSVGHYNPLTIATTHFLFSSVGMSYFPYFLLSLVSHLSVITATYFLAKEIFSGNRFLALSVAFLFGILAAPHQATSWVVANIATQWSSFLGIISVIFFLKFLKNRHMGFLSVSLGILFVSLLFKEITIGLFPLFLILYWIHTGKKKSKSREISLICGVGGVYLLLRVVMLFSPNITGDKLITESQSAVKILYNFATVPLKSISQTLIPANVIKEISKYVSYFFPRELTGPYGSPQFEVFAVKRVMEGLSLLISLGVFLVIFKVARKAKDNNLTKQLISGGLWIILGSFIFSISPEQSGIIFAVDSRNLYFVSVGFCLVMVSIFNVLSGGQIKRFFAIFMLFVLLNLFWLNNSLSRLAEESSVRRYILATIMEQYPNLPKKAVFYTQSDSSYYGLPAEEKIMPFQSGFGQTLMVWYYSASPLPVDFFRDRFLWKIDAQGYQEADGRGYGYFRDYDLLVETVRKYNLETESVIAFSWNGVANELVDITGGIRKTLKEDVKKPH